MTTSASARTRTTSEVPGRREDDVTPYGPDDLPPHRRRRVMEEIEGLAPADLLARAWTAAPVKDEHAFIQLVGGCIQYDVERGGVTDVLANIERFVPDRVLERLPGLTAIEHDLRLLNVDAHKLHFESTDEWRNDGFEVILGPVAERLRDNGADTVHPKALADATSRLMSNGDVEAIERLFKNTAPNAAGEPDANTADAADDAATTAANGAGGTNEVNNTPRWTLFAPPPVSRPSAYRGHIDLAAGGSKERSVASPNRTAWDPNRVSNEESGRSRVRLHSVPTDVQEALLDRSPLGNMVPRVAFPTEEVYERIIEWRPILEDAEPLAAILQLILISDKRDDNYDPDQACTGMPFWHMLVLAAFGFESRQQAFKEAGVNTGQLFQLYRKHIDSGFLLSGWDKKKGLARVVLAHSIPDSIITAVEEHMLGPEEPDDTTYLINGLSADRDNNRADHDERIQEVEERESEIPLPDFTERMQSYLHGLTEKSFSHGSYGYVGVNIDKAFEAAREEFKDAQRRRQVLRKLYMTRQYPKPLYPGCDFFPRLTAEGHNQLMNMPSKILRTLYTDRDREMDLNKAHLATTSPLARKNGIDATVLDEHLDRNLNDEDYDLWMDVASYFDVEYMSAARTAAKKLYSGAYGGSEQELLRQMCLAYADAGGTQFGYDPFKPVLDHPLVDELLRIREEIRAVIKDRGYLVDAAGRKIRPEMMTHKDEGDRWKTVMAYTNASFEQRLMYQPFKLAIEEQKRSRPRFTIWLYQSDGITVRFSSRASISHQVQRIQGAVAEKADELGIPTELEIDWPA